MTHVGTIFLLALMLTLPPQLHAADLSSPNYRSLPLDSLAGAGSAASPDYSARAAATGNAFGIRPGTASPGYRLSAAIPALAGKTNLSLPTGDINGDGSLTVADALLALQVSDGSIPFNREQLKNGDVAPFLNGQPAPDGSITVADALIILRKLVRLVIW
jgi:hypothetical protein